MIPSAAGGEWPREYLKRGSKKTSEEAGTVLLVRHNGSLP